MTLHDSIRGDVDAIFLGLEDFAENILYKFQAGGSVTVKAIVDRNPVQIWLAGDWVLPDFVVVLANTCEPTGIPANKVDTGGDEIELLAEFGGTIKKTVSVLTVLERDVGGAMTLALK